jgi:hypothetical protein
MMTVTRTRRIKRAEFSARWSSEPSPEARGGQDDAYRIGEDDVHRPARPTSPYNPSLSPSLLILSQRGQLYCVCATATAKGEIVRFECMHHMEDATKPGCLRYYVGIRTTCSDTNGVSKYVVGDHEKDGCGTDNQR